MRLADGPTDFRGCDRVFPTLARKTSNGCVRLRTSLPVPGICLSDSKRVPVSISNFGRSDMSSTLKILCVASALTLGIAGPAAAQDAKALLRAADEAVGASKVN